MRYTYWREGIPYKGTIHSKNKKSAWAQFRTVQNEADTGGFLEPSAATVAAHLKKWLETVGLKSGSTTIERYTQICDSHIIPALGEVLVQKLQPIQIQEFIDRCQIDGRLKSEGRLSKRTALHIHRIFKLALKQAVGWRLLKTNPMEGIEAPLPRQS